MANYIGAILGPELHTSQIGFIAGHRAVESYLRIHAATIHQAHRHPWAVTVYWDLRNAFPCLGRSCGDGYCVEAALSLLLLASLSVLIKAHLCFFMAGQVPPAEPPLEFVPCL
eukprot:5607292-Amphidinium_carterae.3